MAACALGRHLAPPLGLRAWRPARPARPPLLGSGWRGHEFCCLSYSDTWDFPQNLLTSFLYLFQRIPAVLTVDHFSWKQRAFFEWISSLWVCLEEFARVCIYPAGKRTINFHEWRLSVSKPKSPIVSSLPSTSFPCFCCGFSEISSWASRSCTFLFHFGGTRFCVTLWQENCPKGAQQPR